MGCPPEGKKKKRKKKTRKGLSFAGAIGAPEFSYLELREEDDTLRFVVRKADDFETDSLSEAELEDSVGVVATFGTAKSGGVAVQSVAFDRDALWTPDEAATWLADNLANYEEEVT